MLPPADYFVPKLLDVGRRVRTALIEARQSGAALAGISKTASADTIYSIDTHVEPILIDFCDQWSRDIPLTLIAEGIDEQHHDTLTFPRGIPSENAAFRLLIDPIDGTRGIMYDKRPAWFLAGIAPNNLDNTRLSDIFVAAQVELPTSKQNASDLLWAAKGKGANVLRETLNTTTGEVLSITPLAPSPSKATTLSHGFASIANFFPGTKELASRLMEKIAQHALPKDALTRGTIFDDQYISTGGQLYEPIMGHDRFIADLRPLFYKIQNGQKPPGLSAHPYDLATALIATESGILLTNGKGQPLDGPLDTTTPLSFAAFANPSLRTLIEPIMLKHLTAWLRHP